MKTLLQIIFFLALASGIQSCRIEKAKAFKKQYITIASDCLTSEDLEIFKSLKKYENIEVQILHLQADSIIQKLKREGRTTMIDVVIVSSVYTMNRIDNEGLLQKLSIEDYPESVPFKHIAHSRSWAGFGIDPYLIKTYDDSLRSTKNYNDLLKKQWCTNLSEDKLVPLYSFVARRMGSESQHSISTWIETFESNKVVNSDSLSFCSVSLLRYSTYKKPSSKKLISREQLVFPNQRKGGYYYDMPCIGIVNQARNYYNATILLKYLYKESFNKGLNYELHTLPLIHTSGSDFKYQNIRYRRSIISPVQLTNEYAKLNRIK